MASVISNTLLKPLILCVALLCAGNVSAQTSRIIRAGADLSSNLINDIFCDRDGVVWVCTDNGINRLDAAKNRSLISENSSGNTFLSAFQDKEGRLWFCGGDNIFLFDKNTEKLVKIDSYDSGNMMQSVRATRMLQRKDGTLLACTAGHGVFRLEEKNGKMQFRQFDLLTNKPLKGKSAAYYISNMIEDNDGNIWICSELGLYRITKHSRTYIKIVEKAYYSHFSFLKLAKDGYIWCGNHAGGVWRINPRTLKADAVTALSGVGVECIATNHKNEVLVGTNGFGAWEIDSKTLEVKQQNFDFGNITNNRLNIHALEDDSYGNLWIGCYQKGVLVVPKIEERFHCIGSNNKTDIIGNSCVMSLGKDKGGRLWVAGDNDGLYMLQGASSIHYAPSPTMPKTVMAQCTDSKGRMWLGTWLQGLWVMEPSTGKAYPVELPTGGKAISVFAIHEDRKGRMWIGTQGHGMYCIEPETGKITLAPKVNSGLEYSETKNIIPNNWINDLAKGPGDILFVATCDGVGAFNLMTGDCLKTFKGRNRLLGSIDINTVCYTSDNRLWLGTCRGLYSVDLKTLEQKVYRQDHGLLGNVVQSIVDNGDGTLWISTNAGVAQMRLKDNSIVNFSSHNGMYGNEFSRNAKITTANGIIWFGGTEGVSFFNPKNVVTSKVKPKFFITGLYVDGQYVTPSTESGGNTIMDADVMRIKKIQLAYNDNSFTIEFSTLNYMSNDAMTYEYRIDDGQWRSLPVGINTVSFSNMEPGDYEITFRAMQQGRYSDERVISVCIHSPWYATWWAYILYLLIVLGFVYVIVSRVRQRQADAINQLKMRQEQDISEAKLQFFINISHEIRTPMTLILSPLQRLIANDSNSEHQQAYQRMNRNAQRILQLINQMLDVRKIDKGQMQLYFREVEMSSYLSDLVNGFHDLCDTKHISINFISNVQLQGADNLRAWIDPMNFEKIIVNLISNSYKYTPEEGNIEVTLSNTEKEYSIRVEDSGTGLNEDEIEHIFDRFYQLRNGLNHTAQKLGKTGTVIQGTGIGLNLTNSLVELHHGSITCGNNGDGKPGCHFVVTLPLGRDHLNDSEIDTSTEELAMETVAPVVEKKTVEKAKPKTRKRIFVVEDDPEISNYLKEELSRDFVVTVCNNGEEALNLLLKKTKCDLVISDVLMPVMDGLQMLRHIRQNTDINSLPVILLTAKVTDVENIEGLQAGADAYITKPFNIEVLRTTAKNLIKRQGQLKNIYSGSQSPEVEKKIKVMSPDEKLMKRIMKVITANLDNPDLGNELITREVGISRVHLYRKLKELTNLSLRDFIRNIRLNEAARLLSEQKHNVSEIAQRTGFDNVSYFTVIFKQRYGIPPSQYHGQSSLEKKNGKDETKTK